MELQEAVANVLQSERIINSRLWSILSMAVVKNGGTFLANLTRALMERLSPVHVTVLWLVVVFTNHIFLQLLL